MTLGEALRLGLGQEVSEVGLPVLDMEGEGWVQSLLEKLSEGTRLSLIKTPANFRGQLRPYQLKEVSWLAFLSQFGLGACLADDIGLGSGRSGALLPLSPLRTARESFPSSSSSISKVPCRTRSHYS
jgi:hypothetical protein